MAVITNKNCKSPSSKGFIKNVCPVSKSKNVHNLVFFYLIVRILTCMAGWCLVVNTDLTSSQWVTGCVNV